MERAGRIIGWLPHLPSAFEEHLELRRALDRDRLEIARLREALRQANASHAFQDRFHSTPAPSLVASVIGRTALPTQHGLLLDRGTRQGVLVGSIVVGLKGLIGRVVEASPDTSVAMMVTDSESRVACVVERSRESGLLIGTLGTRCQLIYLDPDADVEAGDRVVTAGFEDGAFPKGLVVGTVEQVVRDQPGMMAWAWVRPAVSLSRTEDVLVMPSAR